jgi:hypothetical protein
MGHRFLGAMLFLLPALWLFEMAARLASDQRGGWGWFLAAGLILAGIAVNLWTGENEARRPACRKSTRGTDLE